MKAKSLDLATCKGRITLHDVVYHFIDDKMVKISFDSQILDDDLKKIHLIIETELRTERDYNLADSGSGYHLTFVYPFTLIRGMVAK